MYGEGKTSQRMFAGLLTAASVIGVLSSEISWAHNAESSDTTPDEKRDMCAGIEHRIAQRRQWLADRRIEQFARGGAPNPDLGIPDVTWQWCEAHPEDVECNMPKVTVFFTTEELRGGQAPEDYDPHVILMKRERAACRDRERRGRPSKSVFLPDRSGASEPAPSSTSQGS